MTTLSPDYLALALLALTAVIALFLRVRFGAGDDASEQKAADDDLFFHQQHLDPRSMRLPLTGLGQDALLRSSAGYLPEEMARLLQEKSSAAGDETTDLAAMMRLRPRANTDQVMAYFSWTVTVFVVLLGLFFLLLRILALV